MNTKRKFKNKSIRQRLESDDLLQLQKLCYSKEITEEYIREFKNQIPLNFIIPKMQLSKDFLREMFPNSSQSDKYISFSQHLDEKFIEQWKNRIEWNVISHTKNNFSQQFLLKWSQKLDWEAIWKINKKWSQQFWEYLKNKVKK